MKWHLVSVLVLSQDIDYQVLDPKLLVGHYFLSCGI